MAVRQTPPMQQRPFAVNAAILLSLALFAAPALAVTSTALPCNKSKETTLDVRVTDRLCLDAQAGPGEPRSDLEDG